MDNRQMIAGMYDELAAQPQGGGMSMGNNVAQGGSKFDPEVVQQVQMALSQLGPEDIQQLQAMPPEQMVQGLAQVFQREGLDPDEITEAVQLCVALFDEQGLLAQQTPTGGMSQGNGMPVGGMSQGGV